MAGKTVTVTVSRRTAWRVLGLVEMEAEEQGYGNFPGGDPRDFTPDPECSTDEERAAHARDCDAMNAGGQALMPSTARWENGSHWHESGYGLGTYVIRNPKWIAIRDELRAAMKDGV